VAVLRALKLGDLLCAVPALRALRAALPEADVRLIGLPWSTLLLDRFGGYLDELFELPGFPGFPERPFDARAFARFLDEVHAWGPDLVLQLHGSGGLANPLATLLGGRITAGFYEPGAYCPDPARFLPYPHAGPEVRRHLRVLEHLGVPLRGDHKEFPVRDGDRDALAAAPGAGALVPGAYACVHPGASVPERRWPVERFAAVADALAERGLRVVLTGGPEEAPITRAVAGAMRTPVLDLAGHTDLGPLAALLEGARLLVSNDTGIVHIAEGVRAPSVIVSFMAGAEIERWAPLDRERHRYLAGGMGVRVEQVVAQAAGLLKVCTPPAARS
jgi:ADP-heptose:LPS heptosyltransferase